MASSGNFAVWNRLANVNPSLSYSAFILDKGATRFRGNTGGTASITSSLSMPSGKWYVEVYSETSPAGGWPTLGILKTDKISIMQNVSNYQGYTSSSSPYRSEIRGTDGKINAFNSTTGATVGGSAWTAGDVLQIAVDIDAGKWWFGKNNTYFNSGDPAAGSGQVDTFTAGTEMSIWVASYNGSSYLNINAGQDSTFAGNITAGGNADENGFGDFKYQPPASFLALCSGNLSVSADIDPAQTDDNFPQKNFGIVTYTGNSTTGQTVSGLGFKPDLIWAKMTSSSQNNQWFDSSRMNTRGTPTPFMLRSDTTAAEIDDQAQGNNNPMIASFDTDGFTLGTSGSGPNDNNREYIAWCWRANGGTTTSDSSGDITVTRQTNDVAKFSILTYTGNGSSGSTIAHGLGVKPAMTIIKQRNSSNGWNVWHQGFNNGDYDSFGELNGTGQWYANQGASGPFSNNPTTSLLPLTAYGQVNGSGNTYVCYAWAEVEGYSKFGSYEASSNSDGPFVYLGFRPAFIMIKGTVSGAAWIIKDDTLDGFNPGLGVLQPNSTAAKYTSAGGVCDILANGFKVRTDNAVANSTSYDPYLYAAWGSVPFKYNNTF